MKTAQTTDKDSLATFDASAIPPQIGKTFLVTGANSGIGLEASRYLGRAGATIVMLCRNEEKAQRAIESVKDTDPQGTYEFVQADLSDLKSVRSAARAIVAEHPRIDAAVYNAGVMMLPKREETTDGFEKQIGVNALGHFALAAELAPAVEQSAGRHVWVTSIAHRYASSATTDFVASSRYNPFKVYAQSKLMDAQYATELQRRLSAGNCTSVSTLCHPGWSATALQSSGPSGAVSALLGMGNKIFAQSAQKGAAPLVFCATSTQAQPATLYGPTGMGELKGQLGRGKLSTAARNSDATSELWSRSVDATQANWSI